MSDSPKKSIDPSIVAALIGVIGTIIVTLISIYANRPPAPQPTPVPPTAVVYTETVMSTVVPTDTVPANEPTSTPAPVTTTPSPIPTPTLIPIGADWQDNCISSLWVPYPSELEVKSDDIGCLIQPFYQFYTTAGRLAFTFDDRVSTAQIYGVFAKLPSDGTVDIDVQLTTVVDGEVLIGIFANPDVDSTGAMITIPASNNVTKKQKMILKTMPGQRTFSQTTDPLSADPPIYDAHFDFTSGNIRIKVSNDQIDLGSVAVVSPEKWLFLGYQVFNGTNTIQAEFLNLIIQSR